MPFTNPSTRSLGGKARQAKMTEEERRAFSKRALKIRWDKAKAKGLKKAA